MNRCLSRKLRTAALISLGLIVFLLLIHLIPYKEEMEVPEEHTMTMQPEETEATVETEAIKLYSDLPAEDCQLCGHGKGTLLPAYRGQDNVGIISLNTFTLTPIEINPYDDDGNPSVRPSRGSSTHIRSCGEDGYTSFTSENQWRGYAHGTITFKKDEFLDIERAAAFLCNDCFCDIMEECWDDEPYGVGIIDLKTGEIRLLEERITAFTFNDYYIDCDLRERGEEDSSAEMDLLIFYCPERYEK